MSDPFRRLHLAGHPSIRWCLRIALFDYFKYIADRIDLGISIFNTEQAGYTISPEVFGRLAEIPNVCALKNGLPPEHTDRVREIVGDSIMVVDPQEENFMRNMLKWGQRTLYTGANMMFDNGRKTPMRDYVHAFLDGRVEEAEKLYALAQPIRDLHIKWVLTPWGKTGLCPVSVVKAWSELNGMTGGPTPRPLPQLMSPADREELAADLAAVGLL